MGKLPRLVSLEPMNESGFGLKHQHVGNGGATLAVLEVFETLAVDPVTVGLARLQLHLQDAGFLVGLIAGLPDAFWRGIFPRAGPAKSRQFACRTRSLCQHRALRAGLVPFLGKKMMQAREQERAKTAFVRTDGGHRIVLQQEGEESLGQILGILRRIAASPHVGIEWMPVDLAEFGRERRAPVWYRCAQR